MTFSAQLLSCVQLFATPWTVACQALLSMEFFRQKYWCGLPVPPPGDLPNTGIKPTSPVSPALAGRFFTTEPPGNPPSLKHMISNSQSNYSVTLIFLTPSSYIHNLGSPGIDNSGSLVYFCLHACQVMSVVSDSL